jgi:pyruvate,water dikinase
MSHGAIVARELGLPCVTGTEDGTRRLRTGDLVRVDGAAGRVELLERVPVGGVS